MIGDRQIAMQRLGNQRVCHHIDRIKHCKMADPVSPVVFPVIEVLKVRFWACYALAARRRESNSAMALGNFRDRIAEIRYLENRSIGTKMYKNGSA